MANELDESIRQSIEGRQVGKRVASRIRNTVGDRVPQFAPLPGASLHHAERIATAIERIARVVRSSEYEDGLNPAQWEALRYIARANHFSNAPTPLSSWLGATKGTVSQTVTALERKGLISKTSRPGPGRGVTLALTAAGELMLKRDPSQTLIEAAMALGTGTLPLAHYAETLLDLVCRTHNVASFGTCSNCKFLKADPKNPGLNEKGLPVSSRCAYYNTALNEENFEQLCIQHVARSRLPD